MNEMLGELVATLRDGRAASASAAFVGHQTGIGCLSIPEPCAPRWQVGARRAHAARSRRHGTDHGWYRRARNATRPASGDSSWRAEPVARQPKGSRGRKCRRDRIGADRARCFRTDRIVRRGGPRFVAGSPGRHTGRASVDRRHSRRRSARRRRVRGTDATSPRRGTASENRCGVEPARTDRVCGPVGVRVVFIGSRSARLSGPGQLRGRQCIPRRARTASQAAGAAGCLHGVGMVGAGDRDDGPSRRARSRAHEPQRLYPDVVGRWSGAFRRGAPASTVVRHAGTVRPRHHPIPFSGRGPATNVPWVDPCATAYRRVGCGSRALFRSSGSARGDEHVRREHELLDIVRSNAAAVLGHDSGDALGADQEFKELGFDSLGAVEFRNRLKSATGLKLPTTAVFEHPTPTALARYLAGALDTDGDAARWRRRKRAGRTGLLAVDGLSTRHRRGRCTLSGPPDRTGGQPRPPRWHGESDADARMRAAGIPAERRAAIAFRVSRRRVRPARRRPNCPSSRSSISPVKRILRQRAGAGSTRQVSRCFHMRAR